MQEKIQVENNDIHFNIGHTSVATSVGSGDIDYESLVSLPHNLLCGGKVSPFPVFFNPSFIMCDNCNFTSNISFKGRWGGGIG